MVSIVFEPVSARSLRANAYSDVPVTVYEATDACTRTRRDLWAAYEWLRVQRDALVDRIRSVERWDSAAADPDRARLRGLERDVVWTRLHLSVLDDFARALRRLSW